MTNLTSHASAKNTHRPLDKTMMDTCPVSYAEDDTQPDTPSVLRAEGICLPHDQSAMDLNDLQELLDIDLKGSSDIYINETDLLTKNMGIFPDSKLLFLPSRRFLNGLKLYDRSQKQWITPDLGRLTGSKVQSEEKLATFLNSVCDDIQNASCQMPLRRWNSNFFVAHHLRDPDLQET